MANIRAAIFDIDGTLVDSNDAHARAWVEALAEAGHKVAFEKVRPLIGMGGDKLMPEVCGVSEESDEGKQISKRRGEIFKQKYLPHLKPFPRVRELLEHMRERGLRLGVATSAKKDELAALLKIAGADDLVETATTSSDAENSKPDPDIVQAALDRLKLPSEQVLMVGDTPYDIEAARKAGMGTIAVRCGGHDRDLKGALAVYDDPADLLARYDSSPLA